MSYSVTWDGGYEASPDGATVDADTLDTIVQELKVAIRERMNTILDPSGQWDDDPIVLKPNRVGAVLLLPASAWQKQEAAKLRPLCSASAQSDHRPTGHSDREWCSSSHE